MNSNRNAQKPDGGSFYTHGLAAAAKNAALLQAIRAMVDERNEQLAGQLTSATAPAVRLAYEGLYKSDCELVEAGNALAAASEKLRRTYEALPDELRGALGRAVQAKTAIQAGQAGLAVATAAGEIISIAEPVSSVVDQTVGSALMFSHLILVEVHNANARYLGRKEWIHAKEVEAFRILLEGGGHDVLHLAVITGAGALGIAFGHAILPLGLAVAGIQVVYKMTRSQVEEARKQEAAADARYEKRYALQQMNENLAADTRQGASMLADAQKSAENMRACLKAAVMKLDLEEKGLSGVLDLAADLQEMQALERTVKSGMPKSESDPSKKGP